MTNDFICGIRFDGKDRFLLQNPDKISEKRKIKFEQDIKDFIAENIAKYTNIDISKDKYTDAFVVKCIIDRLDGTVSFKLENIPIETKLFVTSAEIPTPYWYTNQKLTLKQRIKILFKGEL